MCVCVLGLGREKGEKTHTKVFFLVVFRTKVSGAEMTTGFFL